MSAVPGTPAPHGAWTEAADEARTDKERRLVKEWERDRLIELGVEQYHAELAASNGIDWHDVERLVLKGCAPELALDIAA